MPVNKKSIPFLLLFVLIAGLIGPAIRGVSLQPAQPHKTRTSVVAKAPLPKLVVVIVVDQFRYDFLERFKGVLTRGGFRRLMEGGAFFTEANYDYIPTYTAPGHAAVFTGSIPALDGIVGNSWFDRDNGKVRAMVMDDAAHLVTNDGVRSQSGAPSPRQLTGTTIGDQMRLATQFQSKVIAISMKDRAAVFSGGQRPSGAFWFDSGIGRFVSSDYYFPALPQWVKQFNELTRPDRYFGAHWDRTLKKDDAYPLPPSFQLPEQTSPLGGRFPYTVTGGADKLGPRFYNAFEYSPFALEYLAEFSKAAIEGESLGADPFPDLLALSFSTTDLVGHAYGPDSPEVEDLYIRLDRVLEDLLNFIDRRVSLANTIIVLTGDHGVSPIPEFLKSKGLPAGRIPGKGVEEAANQALSARFGEGKWVLAFVNDQLYLDHKLMAQRRVDPGEAERVAGEATLTVPGLLNYFTRTQLLSGNLQHGPLARRATNGFNRLRSGDVWVITEPFAFIDEGKVGTTHGSPYNYDTHVPVILFGRGVHPGRYPTACTPSDIAPTLAALLGVEPPSNRYGRVLEEALEKQVIVK